MPTLLHQLTSLNRGITRYGKAPHKPVLLLAVVEGFEKGDIIQPENKTSFGGKNHQPGYLRLSF
jgi:hypothetical protein